MFSSHRNLDRKESNPIKGMIIKDRLLGTRFRIVDPKFNSKLEISGYKFQAAASKDSEIHELDLDTFWNTFTTRL